ncbi:GAF domain-containing protein [Schlegelella sp. S2-27]|uniref:GAF domain-containing protein n=1 Tax=Caldimonas mangrovi TaxID=2944811 RepID=A0ABT0YS23_9BURK|nr:GAF domain-containing protein [Caldimonas mangrovi]MCM5681531.1 GAF domain-containing protein [Caldimonas mangrovi]
MSMPLRLDDVRPCFEGAIPAMMATCAPDGTPNVAYLSQVEYVDGAHLALSFQFFNTTRRNVLANPLVEILVVHPMTAAIYRIRARYLRTETSGPLFENMKARLSGIASHTGMGDVFKLQGADIYHVLGLEHVPKPDLPAPAASRAPLPALRRCSERLARCSDLDELLQATLDGLRSEFDIQHAMLLMTDVGGGRLYTVASCGYSSSGIGSEVPLGHGVIGVAARERTPVRISHMTAEYTYSRAIRDSLTRQGQAAALELEIPWPGLAEPHSQLAVPLCAGGELVGVLFVESLQDLRFSYDDEDALVSLAAQIAPAVRQLQSCADQPEEPVLQTPPAGPAAVRAAEPVTVRYYSADSSVFLGNDYLIKGVAGAILWKLLRDHVELGRTEFTNRELRLDAQIRLPDVSDNLEARLVLLARRLVERDACVRIGKTGRGRFRLDVSCTLQLQLV